MKEHEESSSRVDLAKALTIGGLPVFVIGAVLLGLRSEVGGVWMTAIPVWVGTSLLLGGLSTLGAATVMCRDGK